MLQAHKVTLVQPEVLEQLVLKVLQVVTVLRVLQAHKDHKVILVRLEAMEQLVLKVLQGVTELQVPQVLRVLLVRKVHKAI